MSDQPSHGAVPIPFRKDRLVCVFCAKPLIVPDGSSFDGLFLASEAGVVIASCREHGALAKILAVEVSTNGGSMLSQFEHVPPKDGEQNW